MNYMQNIINSSIRACISIRHWSLFSCALNNQRHPKYISFSKNHAMVYMSMHTSQCMYNNPKGNIKTLSKKTDNLVIHYQLGNRQRVCLKQLINIDWLCCIISSLHCINLIHFSPFVKYFYWINLFVPQRNTCWRTFRILIKTER